MSEQLRNAPGRRVQNRPRRGRQGILTERRRQVPAAAARAAHGGGPGEECPVPVSPSALPPDPLEGLVRIPQQQARGRQAGHHGAALVLATDHQTSGGLRSVPRAVRLLAAERAFRAARAGDERHVPAFNSNPPASDVPGPETGWDRLSRGVPLRVVLTNPSNTD